MLFRLPHRPLCFQIPDEWWHRSGASAFSCRSECYRWYAAPRTVATVIAPLASVAPMLRLPGVERQAFGFRDHGLETEKGGMPDVLEAIVTGVELPSIIVQRTRHSRDGFDFKIKNGFHRFYASHALGFNYIPCGILPDDSSDPSFGDL